MYASRSLTGVEACREKNPLFLGVRGVKSRSLSSTPKSMTYYILECSKFSCTSCSLPWTWMEQHLSYGVVAIVFQTSRYRNNRLWRTLFKDYFFCLLLLNHRSMNTIKRMEITRIWLKKLTFLTSQFLSVHLTHPATFFKVLRFHHGRDARATHVSPSALLFSPPRVSWCRSMLPSISVGGAPLLVFPKWDPPFETDG